MTKSTKLLLIVLVSVLLGGCDEGYPNPSYTTDTPYTPEVVTEFEPTKIPEPSLLLGMGVVAIGAMLTKNPRK